MPDGARNWTVEPGQVVAGPEMEQVGVADTVRTTSLVLPQPLACMTVKRSVALGDDTWAVVFKESGESITAVPETTLQVVEVIGKSPGVAEPCNEKVVEAPCAHSVWLAPALVWGPSRSENWMGSMKSTTEEESEGDVLV